MRTQVSKVETRITSPVTELDVAVVEPNAIVAAIHYKRIGGCAMCRTNLEDPYLIKMSNGIVVLMCDACGPHFLRLTGFTGAIAEVDRLSGLEVER